VEAKRYKEAEMLAKPLYDSGLDIMGLKNKLRAKGYMLTPEEKAEAKAKRAAFLTQVKEAKERASDPNSPQVQTPEDEKLLKFWSSLGKQKDQANKKNKKKNKNNNKNKKKNKKKKSAQEKAAYQKALAKMAEARKTKEQETADEQVEGTENTNASAKEETLEKGAPLENDEQKSTDSENNNPAEPDLKNTSDEAPKTQPSEATVESLPGEMEKATGADEEESAKSL
jgi:hypothetical protein